MSYTPRTTTPTSGDLRWTNTSYGGYNDCIVGKPTAWTGSVLANCTGYVHGRWMEIGDTNTDYGLSLGNAKEYYTHSDSYERGSTPKVGAILCLGGGSAGHVAVVEEVLDNGDIWCSESNYGSTTFEYVKRYKSTGYMRKGGTVSGFQGFIYHPNPDPHPVIYYNVNCTNCIASKTSATSGETVTITASIPKGYKIANWKVSGISISISKTTNVFSFVMPTNNVTIICNLVKLQNSSSICYYIRCPYKAGFM
jgi:surface antigen